MRIETFGTADELLQLAPEWDALADRLSPWLPFRTAQWNLAYWRHFRRRSTLVRDDLHTFAIRDDSGRLVAVAPMMLTSRPGIGLPLLGQLRYLGADTNITELRGLVCDPADQSRVLNAMSTHLAKQDRRWELLHWAGLDARDPAVSRLTERNNHALTRTLQMYCIVGATNWDQFKTALPRNTKEALRKCYNALRRDGHGFTFEIASAPGDVDAALGRFFDLHAARASADLGVAHNDAFAAAESRAFLLAYARIMAAQDRLRVFRLRIGDTIVATRVGFIGGSDLYLYYSGFDPDWARYSVMTTTTAEALKWAMGNGFSCINLSFGRDKAKLRWRPQEWEFVEAVQFAQTLRGHTALAALRALRRFRGEGVGAINDRAADPDDKLLARANIA
jgi:CelD/BcsL family acetyltransferase involved in cellulose biosynthesis